jgi:prepilin-type N-terminal cleavage/methylation domain-containing protein
LGCGDRFSSGPGATACAAFTLLELLTVIAIIGVLAAFAIPALKGISQSNALGAANRQLLDDVALARLRAISGRTTVYMVFMPPIDLQPGLTAHRQKLTTPAEVRHFDELLGKQLTAYALLARRSLGDQPGRSSPRYLTEWRSLPDGVFLRREKFRDVSVAQWLTIEATNRPFARYSVPFPTDRSPELLMPAIAFNAQGQVQYTTGVVPIEPGEAIPLTRGSVQYPKDASGQYTAPDIVDILARSYASNYNYIRIDWLTGRARVEQPEVSP